MDKQLEDHIMRDDKRLDRIEEKIDKLAETVISLARAEEKLVALEDDRQIIHERIDKQNNRIATVEKKTDENEVTIRVINRLFWIIVSAGITALAAYITIQ